MNQTFPDLIEIAVLSAIEAGKVLLKYYNKNYQILKKADDSPVTEADKKSEETIIKYLTKTNIPIISEESSFIEYNERINYEQCWLIDPLDGTKEFINKNGEFTINIALIKGKDSNMGIIYSPLQGTLYIGSEETGSIKVLLNNNHHMSDNIKILPSNKETNLSIVVSRSHLDNETLNFIEHLKTKFNDIKIIKSGSAIKLCKVAEGEAQVYPRFGKTMEWDTAAGHAILKYSNAELYNFRTLEILTYNNRETLVNPPFIAIRKDFQYFNELLNLISHLSN
jgi:3'(2'), 5'-bisphosphate nucleotidase